MNTKKIIFITSLLTALISCSQQKLNKENSVKNEKTSIEMILTEPFIVRVQDKKGFKFVSLSLEYFGKKGLKKKLSAQKDIVQNLIIAILSDYKLKDLKTYRGKEKFQKNILTSLNEFVDENKFTKVNILELKEI